MQGKGERAKNKRATYKRIWQYAKQQRLGMFIAVLCVVITTLLSLAGPYLIGVIIDQYILQYDINGAIRMAVILAAIYVATAIFSWLQTFVMIRVALHTMQKLRMDLFKHLQTLSLSFFDKRQKGDLMSRVTNDIDNLNTALAQSVVQIASAILTVVGVGIAMFALNWQLAIAALIILPLIAFATKQIIKRSTVNYAARQRDLGALNGYIAEMQNGAEVITLFGKEQQSVTSFNKMNESLRQSAQRAEITSGMLGPINNFMNHLGMALVLGASTILAVQGAITIGMIATFTTYTRQFFRPLLQLSNLLNTFQAAIAGAERVFEILDEEPQLVDSKHAQPCAKLQGDVRFDNVSFGYDDKGLILKNISLHAKAGETIALVGATGSGKTTIIQLIMRFYAAQQGEITFDGTAIEDITIKSLRQHIGIVLQDTYLFSGTVREAIRYGKLEATDAEVEAAAKLAHAHDFIKHLPEQYDTPISAGGMNLSQGQRQLLAIARAMLENADILILDEATSSVDTRTEVDIQNGLQQLMYGKTSFVIAHRLKTIEQADQILVIQDGAIAERGNHAQLLQKQGLYYKMQTTNKA